jgi:uncharacterized membrane protein YphA (DoxX/SURF4 family)
MTLNNASQAKQGQTMKSFTSYLPTVARLLMGLIFFVLGLNGFLQFMPQPKNVPEGVLAFFEAMTRTGYMIQLISGTQTIVGALLLLNRFVPLALALIAPVVVNILAFHVFLSPSGLPVAFVVLTLEVYLAWSYRKTYRSMLVMKTSPD